MKKQTKKKRKEKVLEEWKKIEIAKCEGLIQADKLEGIKRGYLEDYIKSLKK